MQLVLEVSMAEHIYKGLEIWSLSTLNLLAMALLFLGLVMHMGMGYRSYVGKAFRIRISGETFDLLFTLVRDLALFLAFGFGAMLVNPDTFDDIKLAVPFMPLGTVLLGIGLTIKLAGDVDRPGRARPWFSLMLIAAAAMQYFGFIFVMEAAPAGWIASGTAGSFWLTLRAMRSNVNPQLAMWTFYICFPMLLAVFIAMATVGLAKTRGE